MEIPKHWRLKDIRLGKQSAWDEVIRRYVSNNPHLPFSLLASPEPDMVLDQVHDRVKGILGGKDHSEA